MIVRCPDCRSKYEIAADKMPPAPFKLRCPRCKAVFPVGPHLAEREDSAPVEVNGASASPPPAIRPPAPPRPRISDPVLARRMARAMISEIVLNRRTERDEALRARQVLSSFGPAIAAAWDLYRQKVSPELPGGAGLFRDAVNEILGEGAPLL